MSASPNDYVPEAATRPTRIEFVREDTPGVTPDNPSWNLYSDHVTTWWGWEPEAAKEAEQPAGSMDPWIPPAGPETHEAEIEYKLQNWLVDSNGDALDAAADGMLLSADNSWNNTHSAVSRMDISSNGADGAGYRVYHVGRGGAVTEVELPFETENAAGVTPALTYQFEKMRVFRIDQPSAATTVQVENTGTQQVDVTIEDEGATTSETVTVPGGETTTSTEEFGDIDAVDLSTDVDGSVIVTDGSGTEFVEIKGSDAYTAEGDLGVPSLGDGSHADAIGSDYITFIGTDYGYSTEELAAEIISGSLSVSMEVESNGQMAGTRMNIHPSGRRATFAATVAGESESVKHVTAFLTGEKHDVEWDAGEGVVRGLDAEHMTPGETAKEGGTAKHERELEILAEDLEIN